ncbi:MAG: hypothetical protein WBD36_00525 [Bacteroidota bacterium]
MASSQYQWLRAVILFGIFYVVVGIGFGSIAGSAVSNEMRFLWRLAAWLVSAAAFAVHIGYEQSRLGHPHRITAFHVSMAAALGAFGLAVAANIHELWATPGYRSLLAVALVVWPIMTGVPAFLVALAAAAGLARVQRRTDPRKD